MGEAPPSRANSVKFAIVDELKDPDHTDQDSEQEKARQNYICEVKSQLESESERLGERIATTLWRRESKVSLLKTKSWDNAPASGVLRRRAFSHGDVSQLKRTKAGGVRLRTSSRNPLRLKRQESHTLPNSPLLGEEFRGGRERASWLRVKNEVLAKESPITDNQMLMFNSLILDPKKLFGQDRASLSSLDVCHSIQLAMSR